MRVFTISLFVFLTALMIGSSGQAMEESVVAIVNEDAISRTDLQERVKLITASSGLPNTRDVQQKIVQQVVETLIEEQIKLQEARRLNVEITPEEIQNGFAAIAKQNKFEADQFEKVLRRSGINPQTMRQQIKSQIAWTKVVQRELRPRINISDNDVNNVLERLNSNAGENEYLLAEIFLPVDNTQSENDIRQLAAQLKTELNKGAPFFRLAQQFSKAAGASNGGDVGWVQESQLAKELSAPLKILAKNTVSEPIRSARGYHILFLRDKRQISEETIPDRDQIQSTIGLQRLERLQRQHYLDLKSAAFIDNRVSS